MIELSIIVKGASLGLSVAKYSGVLQDYLKLKVELLAGSELEAGLRALEQAAHSEREQEFLLREARSRFNKSISLEKGVRLAASWVGLALCHSHLGDVVNAERAIREMTEIVPPEPSVLLVVARQGTQLPGWVRFVPHLFLMKAAGQHADRKLVQHEQMVAQLRGLQTEGSQLLEVSLRDGCESVFGRPRNVR